MEGGKGRQRHFFAGFEVFFEDAGVVRVVMVEWILPWGAFVFFGFFTFSCCFGFGAFGWWVGEGVFVGGVNANSGGDIAARHCEAAAACGAFGGDFKFASGYSR